MDDSYEGPRMEMDEAESYHVTETFVKEMMDAFREQKRIHRRFALTVLLAFQRIVKELPSLVDVEVRCQRARLTLRFRARVGRVACGSKRRVHAACANTVVGASTCAIAGRDDSASGAWRCLRLPHQRGLPWHGA